MPFNFHGIALIIALIVSVLVSGTAFWFWMLIDCGLSKRLSDSQKFVWIIIMIFTHLVGAILYFFLGRPRPQKQNSHQPYAQQQAPQTPPMPYYSYQQGYEAAQPAPPPYQQGYQAAQPAPYPYQTGMMSPPPTLQEQPPAFDYEQPQAMYPHEQSNN